MIVASAPSLRPLFVDLLDRGSSGSRSGSWRLRWTTKGGSASCNTTPATSIAARSPVYPNKAVYESFYSVADSASTAVNGRVDEGAGGCGVCGTVGGWGLGWEY